MSLFMCLGLPIGFHVSMRGLKRFLLLVVTNLISSLLVLFPKQMFLLSMLLPVFVWVELFSLVKASHLMRNCGLLFLPQGYVV